jgi:hypothetical protein
MPNLRLKLTAVSEAAETVRASEEDLEEAREKLREALEEAHDAGAPYSLLGDLAGLSRQRVAQLVSDR